jgi:hypothetical protein
MEKYVYFVDKMINAYSFYFLRFNTQAGAKVRAYWPCLGYGIFVFSLLGFYIFPCADNL